MGPDNKRDRLSAEWLDWCQAKDRIGQQLREYYQAFTTEELPLRLRDALKKLDEETENSAEQFEVVPPSRTE
jgi:hypothetical protein